MSNGYVHGYDLRESVRLKDQATTLEELLHGDTTYQAGARVLEAGCGVGAQTVSLAGNSPQAEIVSLDISESSLRQAREKVEREGYSNVEFRQGDIFQLKFEPESFDHVFVCFVLEHLRDPAGALCALKKFLKPGGSITVIEGDHGSTYFHPENVQARAAINCQVELQKRGGGNADIGRQVYPLLAEAGFENIHVSPRMVYADGSRPDLQDGFTRKTFTAMIEGVREDALAAGLMPPADFDHGLKALTRTSEPDGVFCYTFFKGIAFKQTTVCAQLREAQLKILGDS